MVAKELLTDPSVPLESKGIYAYLAGYAGDMDECYPSIERVRNELGISKDRLYKYMNMLVDIGVVERVQTYNGNIRGKVIYKIKDTEYDKDSRFPENAESGNQGFSVSRKCGIREPGNTESREMINNNINNNSLKNNNINNTVCSEPETDSKLSGIKIILNDKTFYDVPLEKIALWKGTYPAVDVEQELKKMASWSDANPAKRKTRRGIVRFINGWLSREQDRGGRGGRYNSQSARQHNSQGVQQDKPFYEIEQPEYLKYLNTELTPEEKAILGEG